MKTNTKDSRIKKLCINCGKQFLIYPYRKFEAKYCSFKCRRTVPIKKCRICKKEFKASNNWQGYGFYCSRRCFAESQKGRTPWNRGIKARDDPRIMRFVTAGHEAKKPDAWNKGLKYGKSNWLRFNGTDDYRIIHKRIARKFGKPNYCEHCKRTDLKVYHWANKSNNYLDGRSDWIRLCPPCHMKYDQVNYV